MTKAGKTGEIVPVTDVYTNKYGIKKSLQKGDVFPVCPKKGFPTEWERN